MPLLSAERTGGHELSPVVGEAGGVLLPVVRGDTQGAS
ncbi:hypothetical protein RKD20_003259 [Streptomyces sp. SLBN-8D4]